MRTSCDEAAHRTWWNENVKKTKDSLHSSHLQRGITLCSLFFIVKLLAAFQRPVQPCTQRYQWWRRHRSAQGSAPPAGRLLSAQYHAHIQSEMPLRPHTHTHCVTDGTADLFVCTFVFSVGHSVPPLLHSPRQHRAKPHRQSVCGSRSSTVCLILEEKNSIHLLPLKLKSFNMLYLFFNFHLSFLIFYISVRFLFFL